MPLSDYPNAAIVEQADTSFIRSQLLLSSESASYRVPLYNQGALFGTRESTVPLCASHDRGGSATSHTTVTRIVELQRCTGIQQALNSLQKLSRLERNWDQAGAEPINEYSIAVAREFLLQLPLQQVAPKVVPMSLGRLQLEWHKGERSLELEFETPSLVHYLKWDSSRDIEDEDVVQVSADDWTSINNLLEWFVQGIEHVA